MEEFYIVLMDDVAALKELDSNLIKDIDDVKESILSDECKIEKHVESVEFGPGTGYVISIDMLHYGSVSSDLQAVLGAGSIMQLIRKIQEIVEKGMESSNEEEIAVKYTGDGAIIAYEQADDVVTVGVAIQEYVASVFTQQNVSRDRGPYFRIGIARGSVYGIKDRLKGHSLEHHEMAGLPVAHAVRIEAKTRPGSIALCERTYQAISTRLKDEITKKYGTPKPKKVPGKEHEDISIRVVEFPVIEWKISQ